MVSFPILFVDFIIELRTNTYIFAIANGFVCFHEINLKKEHICPCVPHTHTRIVYHWTRHLLHICSGKLRAHCKLNRIWFSQHFTHNIKTHTHTNMLILLKHKFSLLSRTIFRLLNGSLFSGRHNKPAFRNKLILNQLKFPLHNMEFN